MDNKMKKYYQGKFKPKNPSKYKGNPCEIYYRSSWEKKFMIFCDNNDSIIEYSSEETVIPYRCPTDGRVHRYYPDFYIKVKSKTGSISKYLIEVKPERQVTGPVEKPKRKTAAWKREVLAYMKNRAKWAAAENFCENRQMRFLILTEHDLGV
jgi:hypothetical protein